MLEQQVKRTSRKRLTIDLQPGEYALIATIHGEFRLFTPGFDLSDDGAVLSKAAIALVAVSESFSDETLVDEVVREFIHSDDEQA